MYKTKKDSFPVAITGVNGYTNWKRVNEFQAKKQRGDYEKVAEKTGFSVSFVSRVLNGKRGANADIIKTAQKIVRNRKSPFTFSY